ncbi:Fe-S cluster assembly protein HesB [Gorillibacterium sp. CAU 1737]|uniref:HesB/YadR/YfhF family protein n=1 Tax=Gorillibacterium sp. CAU 1737 TaxID=3140362 RepID=UPI00325FFCB8
MKLDVTPSAAQLFKNEWGYQQGDQIRVFVRYAGEGDDAFAFGIGRDEPSSPVASVNQDDLHFFMEPNDLWYLDGRDLTIDCGEEGIIFNKL